MPFWTWGTNIAGGGDPILNTPNTFSWSWNPKDDLGQSIFASGDYETIIGWKDSSVMGGGETKRLFGYSTNISFDWDGFISDRISVIFSKSPTPGRSINRGGISGALGKFLTGISLLTGFDGDAKLVFANRFDYQYFGSKLNLTRRCDPTEITVTNFDQGITFSYVLLFLYFTLSATALVMVRVNKNSVSQGTETGMAKISKSFLQPLLADGACLGILKWWDERCIMLVEIKKEYKYLEKKVARLKETIDQITANSTKFVAAEINLANNHSGACKTALDNILKYATDIYGNQMTEGTAKVATALADFNAKIFGKDKKALT